MLAHDSGSLFQAGVRLKLPDDTMVVEPVLNRSSTPSKGEQRIVTCGIQLNVMDERLVTLADEDNCYDRCRHSRLTKSRAESAERYCRWGLGHTRERERSAQVIPPDLC